jgi:hypothetical protein
MRVEIDRHFEEIPGASHLHVSRRAARSLVAAFIRGAAARGAVGERR